MIILNKNGKIKTVVFLLILASLLLYTFKALRAPQNTKIEKIVSESQKAREAIENALDKYESRNKFSGFSLSLDDLEKNFSESEKNMWNLVTLGIIQMQQLEIRKAINSFKEARDIEPSAAEPYIGLGKAYYTLAASPSVIGLGPDKTEAILFCAKEVLKHAKTLRLTIRTMPDGSRNGLFDQNEPDNTIEKVESLLKQFGYELGLDNPIENELGKRN